MNRIFIEDRVLKLTGLSVAQMETGFQEALFFLRFLEDHGFAETNSLVKSPYRCVTKPNMLIEEFFILTVFATGLQAEQTTAISVLLDRCCQKANLKGIELRID